MTSRYLVRAHECLAYPLVTFQHDEYNEHDEHDKHGASRWPYHGKSEALLSAM